VHGEHKSSETDKCNAKDNNEGGGNLGRTGHPLVKDTVRPGDLDTGNVGASLGTGVTILGLGGKLGLALSSGLVHVGAGIGDFDFLIVVFAVGFCLGLAVGILLLNA